ncbi:MAG: BatA domain-containing protein [Gemmataceae bacterium]
MHPILIVGAALVGLPVLLHLIMKQEPKRLPFPAFRFLQQKLKTNQRKLRLRHFLLLALRMLLIALFAVTLYQPTVLSTGFVNLSGDQPVAAVLVIDTSPSMGYADGEGKTRLEEATRRAGELLSSLPDNSRVAVVESGDATGNWLPSTSDARTRLRELAERGKKAATGAPAGPSRPVTGGVGTAYQLLSTVDAESEGSGPYQKLVAVFTDRAAASWDAARADDLKKTRDALPEKPAHAVVDVGVEAPTNVVLLAAGMTEGKAQVVPAGPPVSLTVTVGVVGPDDLTVPVNAVLGDAKPVRKEVAVPRGQTRTVAFEFRDLKPGLYQVKFELPTKDALAADNVRYVTFRVAEPRRVLTIATDPEDAAFWNLAVNEGKEFANETLTPQQLGGKELAAFEAVTLFGVTNPAEPADDPLWPKLLRYVEGGGKLLIIPGGPERMGDRAGYDPTKVEAANKLLPGAFKRFIDTAEEFGEPKDATAKNRRRGVTWDVFAGADDRAFSHPLLAPLRQWRQTGNVDVFRAPRRASGYWEVEPLPEGVVVVRYDDADDPKARRPAVLERGRGGNKGKVIQLTSPMDTGTLFNDYWDYQNSWTVVFPALLLRSAAGSRDDERFNFDTGASVRLPVGKLVAGRPGNLVLDGPGVAVSEAAVKLTEKQADVTIAPPRTNLPGNFSLTGPNPDWREGFSLNVPADESTLDKVPVEGIEDVTGPGSVVQVGRDVDLKKVFEGTDTLRAPVELFPWLLILLLVLMAAEGLVANRFYRRK